MSFTLFLQNELYNKMLLLSREKHKQDYGLNPNELEPTRGVGWSQQGVLAGANRGCWLEPTGGVGIDVH